MNKKIKKNKLKSKIYKKKSKTFNNKWNNYKVIKTGKKGYVMNNRII